MQLEREIDHKAEAKAEVAQNGKVAPWNILYVEENIISTASFILRMRTCPFGLPTPADDQKFVVAFALHRRILI